MGLLERLRVHATRREVVEPAVVLGNRVDPEALHHRDVLVAARASLRPLDAGRAEFLRAPSQPDPEVEPSARQPIERGDVLRRVHRVALGEEADAGREPDSFRDGRAEGEEPERLEHPHLSAEEQLAVLRVRVDRLVFVEQHDVLADPDRREAGVLCVRHGPGDVLRRRDRVDRREAESDLHRAAPTGAGEKRTGSTSNAAGPVRRVAHRLGRDLVVGDAPEQLLEGHPPFESGERGAEAVVRAVAEREVTRDRSPDVEALGVRELAVVEVCGTPDEHDPRPGGDRDPVQLDLPHRGARQHLRRRLDAQHLLDGRGEQRRVGDERGALVGMAGEQLGAVPDQARRGVVAGDEEQEREPEELLVGQVLAVGLGGDQRAHEVVARRDPALRRAARRRGRRCSWRRRRSPRAH